jgi:hypothetical protein
MNALLAQRGKFLPQMPQINTDIFQCRSSKYISIALKLLKALKPNIKA